MRPFTIVYRGRFYVIRAVTAYEAHARAVRYIARRGHGSPMFGDTCVLTGDWSGRHHDHVAAQCVRQGNLV